MTVKKGLNTRSDAIKAFVALAVPILEKQHIRWLIKHNSLFVDFWQKWCHAFKYKYDDFLNDQKVRKKASQSLRGIRHRHCVNKTTKTYADNYVIFHETNIDHGRKKQKTTTKVEPPKLQRQGSKETPALLLHSKESQTDTDLGTLTENTEIIRRSDKIQKKKISEISFSSPVTIATVERITQASQFTQYFAADYLYFLSGGKDEEEKLDDGRIRKRFNQQLSHLEVAQRLRQTLQTTIDNMIEAIETNSLGKKQEAKIKRNIAMIESAMKAARELDLQPVHFLNSIEEGAFSAQTALQGAVSNDRMMIDNGNVIFEQQETKVFQKENIDEDLKRIGDALLDSHIETLSEKELTNDEA